MADYVPVMKTNFGVEIDGIDFGNFVSVTGMGGTADISDDVGGLDRNPRKIPGKVNYETVTLTRNSDPKNMVLKEWWQTVEKGQAPERKAVSIVFFDRDGNTEIARRNLFECVPCGWTMSDLSSSDSSPITETISIVYEDADWG